MARKLRWQMDFKSVDEVSCRVEIYRENYNLTNVTTLTGADNPFEYEEDNSSDLLENIRVKTGYLRVVEETFGELDNLVPTYETQHYIVVKYGSTIVFTGFLQCQGFSNDFRAAPRVREFPVVSPLGILDSCNFSVPQTLGRMYLGTAMKEIINTINPYVANDASHPGYQYVTYPYLNGSPNPFHRFHPWNKLMNDTVICPFNDKFKYTSTADDLYAPETFQFFVESLCNYFGWQLHDTPDGLVFIQLESSNNATRIDVDRLDVFDNQYAYTDIALPDNPGAVPGRFADNNARQETVLPLKSLKLNYDNDGDDQMLSTKYTITRNIAGVDYIGSRFKAFVMTPQGPMVTGENIKIPGVDDVRMYEQSNHVHFANPGVYACVYGIASGNATQISFSGAWIFKYSTSLASSHFLTYTAFSILPYSGYGLLKIHLEKGSSLDTLSSSGWSSNVILAVSLKCGEKYWNGSNWVDYHESVSVAINKNTGNVVTSSSLDYAHDDWGGYSFDISRMGKGPLEISVSIYSGVSNNEYVKITELSVVDPLEASHKLNAPEDVVTQFSNTNGYDNAEIEIKLQAFDSMKKSKYMFWGDGNERNGRDKSYKYMKYPQHLRNARYRHLIFAWGTWYFDFYMSSGMKWRILSESFNLKRAEHTFKLVNIDDYNS